jgi:hypothetical protein
MKPTRALRLAVGALAAPRLLSARHAIGTAPRRASHDRLAARAAHGAEEPIAAARDAGGAAAPRADGGGARAPAAATELPTQGGAAVAGIDPIDYINQQLQDILNPPKTDDYLAVSPPPSAPRRAAARRRVSHRRRPPRPRRSCSRCRTTPRGASASSARATWASCTSS